MGQQLAKPGTRRRLTQKRGKWFDFRQNKHFDTGEYDGLEAKIFGAWDYGYEETYQVISSWTIWVFVTWGSFTVDLLEAALILGIALYLQEHPASIPFKRKGDPWGNGSSWVHNVQAGYCWYHYFVKGRREWPVFLGAWAEVAGDLGAIVEEISSEELLYSHEAHFTGAAEGMSLAFLFDMVRPKKRAKNQGWLIYLVPFATIVAMWLADKQRLEQLSSVARLSDMSSDARR